MESKPGIKTTEFWTMLFTNFFMIGDVAGIWNAVPDNIATIAIAVISGLYAISRGLAKQGVGADPNNPNNYKLFGGSAKNVRIR